MVLLLLTDIVDIIRLHAFERIEGRLWSGHSCFVLFGLGCVKEILQRQAQCTTWNLHKIPFDSPVPLYLNTPLICTHIITITHQRSIILQHHRHISVQILVRAPCQSPADSIVSSLHKYVAVTVISSVSRVVSSAHEANRPNASITSGRATYNISHFSPPRHDGICRIKHITLPLNQINKYKPSRSIDIHSCDVRLCGKQLWYLMPCFFPPTSIVSYLFLYDTQSIFNGHGPWRSHKIC